MIMVHACVQRYDTDFGPMLASVALEDLVYFMSQEDNMRSWG